MGGLKNGHRVIIMGKPQDGLQIPCAPQILRASSKNFIGTSLLVSAILGPFPRNKDVHPESREEARTRRQVSHPNSATMWHGTGQALPGTCFPVRTTSFRHDCALSWVSTAEVQLAGSSRTRPPCFLECWLLFSLENSYSSFKRCTTGKCPKVRETATDRDSDRLKEEVFRKTERGEGEGVRRGPRELGAEVEEGGTRHRPAR